MSLLGGKNLKHIDNKSGKPLDRKFINLKQGYEFFVYREDGPLAICKKTVECVRNIKARNVERITSQKNGLQNVKLQLEIITKPLPISVPLDEHWIATEYGEYIVAASRECLQDALDYFKIKI